MMTAFETTTCGRCGGTGQYSYNQINGSTCFGCSGKKMVLTKRGKAAHNRFLELVSRRADVVQVGDFVKSIVNGKWLRVTEVMQTEQHYKIGNDVDWSIKPQINLVYGKTGHFMNVDASVYSVRTMAEKDAALIEAFKFQETLK